MAKYFINSFMCFFLLLLGGQILFSAEIVYDFYNDNNIEYDKKYIEVYNGKLGLSPAGYFWVPMPTGVLSGHVADQPDFFYQDSQKSILCGYSLAPGGTMLKSTDHGDNWTWISNSGSPYVIIEDNNGYLYANCWASDEVIKSTDYGVTWTNILSWGAQGSTMMEGKNKDIYIWRGTGGPIYDSKLFKTTNQGETWSTVHTNTNEKFEPSWMLELNTGDFIIQNKLGLYKSDDSGSNWSIISQTTKYSNIPSGVSGNIVRLKDNSIYVCGSHIGKSIDEGDTWIDISD
ncbi:MAG: glycoside hydrolase, partial [Spirochaetes bacterium]|nr:glycoside hydrolase [Spirochaetota bacterium]